jgi:tyrosinase
MKKTILFGLTGVIAILGFYALSSFSAKVPAPSNTPIVMCAPAQFFFLPDAPYFNPDKNRPVAVGVRKNVYSLTAAEITAIKNGIAAMKALPATDKTSWTYQAAIHGTYARPLQPSWNSCQHGTDFFLSWHRMYLYYFERILRAKSGDPNLTLPYWDYQTNAALHPDYRNSSRTNPLYDGTRYASINGGGSLPGAISTAINNSLNNLTYFPFQNDLESPHGTVHIAIGGNMQDVYTAGQDPVFWLHHANIDRLWEAWLRKCQGRQNPTADATWMNQTYTFFDETGAAVNMTGNQVVQTAASLSYRYDFPAMLPCDFKLKIPRWVVYRPFRFPEPDPWEKITTRFSFVKAKQLEDVKVLDKLKFNFSDTKSSDRILLELNKVKIEKMPEGAIEIYVNLPASTKATPKSANFAGVVDLFSAAAHAKHTDKNIPLRINISQAVRRLQLKPADLAKMDITAVVRGNTNGNGKEVKTIANIRAESVDLVIEVAQE